MNFISLLDKWYQTNKRQLPWRKTTHPYNIWISEIILQQTRVNQGIDYYNNFISTFPDIESLANASEDQVLNQWKGLGYYSRAHNIHLSAKYIFKDLNNIFPNTFQEILKLKGVGKYTAAAIASISFHEKIPAIDGNAFRVYSRIFNSNKDISKQTTFNYFFNLLKAVMPNNPGDFNQSIMDFGSLICIPKKPNCEICPIYMECLAFKNSNQNILPINKSMIKRTEKIINYVHITCNDQLLVIKRDNSSIWKGLYEFPIYKKNLFENFDSDGIYSIKHQLSHIDLYIYIHMHRVSENDFFKLSKILKAKIIYKNEINSLAFPKPLENYLFFN
ncbi:A/G-specific adenine glycosylase [Apibacter muscae]|uniref:A/G-specific adenine glycosylase n=1 Tax=Apibacter muscae TaxID=2509004 RepID=UPI001626EA9F|nr:A/G-specific adenine glycosylase [Apibacter muscae]